MDLIYLKYQCKVIIMFYVVYNMVDFGWKRNSRKPKWNLGSEYYREVEIQFLTKYIKCRNYH